MGKAARNQKQTDLLSDETGTAPVETSEAMAKMEALPSAPEELFTLRKATEGNIKALKEEMAEIDAKIVVSERELADLNKALGAALGFGSASVKAPKAPKAGKSRKAKRPAAELEAIDAEIIKFLQTNPGQHGKGAIEERTGHTEIGPRLANLEKEKKIVKSGERRNTVYSI